MSQILLQIKYEVNYYNVIEDCTSSVLCGFATLAKYTINQCIMSF